MICQAKECGMGQMAVCLLELGSTHEWRMAIHAKDSKWPTNFRRHSLPDSSLLMRRDSQLLFNLKNQACFAIGNPLPVC